jgi:hypothetical protein
MYSDIHRTEYTSKKYGKKTCRETLQVKEVLSKKQISNGDPHKIMKMSFRAYRDEKQ